MTPSLERIAADVDLLRDRLFFFRDRLDKLEAIVKTVQQALWADLGLHRASGENERGCKNLATIIKALDAALEVVE